MIGTHVWVGDEVQGLHHYVTVDPNNIDPVNTGKFVFDTNSEWSMGGGTACIPWCSIGQVVQDGSTRAYVASYDHAKGQPFQIGGPGVWMIQIQSPLGIFSPFEGVSPVAAGLGLPATSRRPLLWARTPNCTSVSSRTATSSALRIHPCSIRVRSTRPSRASEALPTDGPCGRWHS